MRILIADSTDDFAWTLAETLKVDHEVGISTDGDDAIRMAYSFRPDILVLDTGLHNKDGFFVLQTLQGAGIFPAVVMITSLLTDYVVERAEQLQVKYLMRKPCDLQSVLSTIYSLCTYLVNEQNVGMNPSELINQLLLTLGLRVNLKGYQYTAAAIEILSQAKVSSFTKDLYPKVALDFNGSWKQIERGIRLSIVDAWERRDEKIWRLYFAAGKDGNIPKPTSSTFLSRMAECLKQQRNA